MLSLDGGGETEGSLGVEESVTRVEELEELESTTGLSVEVALSDSVDGVGSDGAGAGGVEVSLDVVLETV